MHENPIEWIAVNSTKPGRNNALTTLVVHSSNAWAELHINEDVEKMQALLLQQLETVTGISSAKATYLTTHRWRYARLEAPEPLGYYLDPVQQLAATGDWAAASRIEDVWLQAMALAKNI